MNCLYCKKESYDGCECPKCDFIRKLRFCNHDCYNAYQQEKDLIIRLERIKHGIS